MKQEVKTSTKSIEKALIFSYFAFYCVIALSLLFKQPFGNPPDEFNRYLIPQYICEHGTLPNGYEESIRIPAYGFSYAFQPILPYMLQGYVMRFITLFTANADILFYSARLVDFLFGLIQASFVLLLSREWFQDKRLSYLFAFIVTFLPQSIFLHTYVNTDSCCMMSIAIMLYGITRGIKTDFSRTSCIILSIGIIFCALSYYNAYGYILSCILLFTAYFLHLRDNRLTFLSKPFLKKGIFISAIVLLGISWWFIRSYLLYDGDFLGLRTRDLCGALYGNENMRPDVRITYQSMGYTIPSMLLQSDFLVLSINSFICMYGPMIMTTSVWIYRIYKLLFLTGLAGNAIALKLKGMGEPIFDRPVLRKFFHLNMVMCMIIPFALSVTYSFRMDYQPQGRYLLPALIPLCYYTVWGFEKCICLFENILAVARKEKPGSKWISKMLTGLTLILLLVVIFALLITVYGYAFPYYASL